VFARPVPVRRIVVGEGRDVAEIGQLPGDRVQLFLEAEVALPAGTVEEGGLAVDAAVGHGAEQGQDRGHPRSAAYEDQVRVGVAQGEDTERAGQLQLV